MQFEGRNIRIERSAFRELQLLPGDESADYSLVIKMLKGVYGEDLKKYASGYKKYSKTEHKIEFDKDVIDLVLGK